MSDVDDEIGLDLSWTSDLKTAWASRDDESASESSGETVGGTTEDDLGDETTSLLPEDVNADELTDKQHAILEAAIMRPKGSKVDVAAAADASPQYVAEICARWFSGHPASASVDDNTDVNQTTLGDWESRDESPESDDDSQKGTIQEEMVTCGKESCRCMTDGEKHGPYLYRYWREGDKVHSEYIGKSEGGEAA